MKATLWTDGGARGNPGPAAAGIVIRQGDEVVWQEGFFLGTDLTNNQAEYLALLRGVTKAKELGVQELLGHMDSQLVVEQVNGRYKVKDAGLQQRWQEVRQALQDFGDWQLTYVPRAENSAADALVNKALDEQGF